MDIKVFFVIVIITGVVLNLMVLLPNMSNGKTFKVITEIDNIIDADLFVFILTGRYNFNKRQLQRDSGLFENLPDNVVYKYVIGNRPCRIPLKSRSTRYTCHGGRPTEEFAKENKEKDAILAEEIKKYDDIIELDMVDFYRALPKKIKLSFEWGLTNTNAKWFLKTDDDCYFNSNEILKGLEKMKHDESPKLISTMRKGFSVIRDGKWGEVNYKPKKYPPFPLGSGYLINKALIKDIVKISDELFEYQGEDVSIGIWIDEFFPNTTIINRKDVFSLKPHCKIKSWVCGHELNERDYKKLLNHVVQ